MAEGDYLLVVAIDFGTTYSGYSFSFKSQPNDIRMNKSWGASLGFQSYKTPTSVLVNPKGEFEAFGFDAEQQYANLEEEDVTPEKYALFEKFKMMLHGKKIGSKLLLHSSNGNIRPAIDVFAMALSYLKDHVIQTISKQVASVPRMKEIRWVLTVPAIWGDAAKQFMREASVKAKLIDDVNSKNLMIALEPEAASLHCRTLEMNKFLGMESEKGKLSLKMNTKYIVIDAGGGTIDITVHETESDGKVKEIYKANGGEWGGSYVDEMYEKMLGDIFGAAFIKQYKLKNPHQWLIMMTDFEKRKRAATPGGKASTNIPLNMGFARQFEKFTGKEFESAFKEESVSGVKFSSAGMLCISPATMARLFEKVISNIKEHLRKLVEEDALSDVKFIFLVGGFGECTFLQSMVHQIFGNGATVLIPEEASMCILKGAVIYGHAPSTISGRISKYTYAIEYGTKFIPGKHNPDYMRTKRSTGENRYDYLESIVKVGEFISHGTVRSSSNYYPSNPEQTKVSFFLYISKEILPSKVHPKDVQVERLAKLTLHSPDTSKGKDRKMEASIKFGGTEIYFKAVECGTENEVATTISFDV